LSEKLWTSTQSQIETHARIFGTYKTLLQEYQDSLRSDPTAGLAGGHPLASRKVERREMRQYASAILNKASIRFDLLPKWEPEASSAPTENRTCVRYPGSDPR